MQPGALTSQFDVALLVLIIFFLFFIGLVYYLRLEDRREGYPLVTTQSSNKRHETFAFMPKPKKFLLPHGGFVMAPRVEAVEEIAATSEGIWIGLPIEPTGDPMVDGVGPGAWAKRSDTPGLNYADGTPRIVPLRLLPEFHIAKEDPDPRGMKVFGADGELGGTITDVWVDQAEACIRYLELDVDTAGGVRNVLVPMPLVRISRKAKTVSVKTILGSQFAGVPLIKSRDQITLLEEDKVSAYFGGGQLYATSARMEPLI